MRMASQLMRHRTLLNRASRYLVCVARHKYGGHISTNREALGKFGAAHPRHDHVGKEEIDTPSVAVGYFERLSGRRG